MRYVCIDLCQKADQVCSVQERKALENSRKEKAEAERERRATEAAQKEREEHEKLREQKQKQEDEARLKKVLMRSRTQRRASLLN